MDINEKIQKSEALIQWMDERIDGLEISSADRSRVSAACLDTALEHQKAIVLLIANFLYGSAFSLSRLIFEAYVRGIWLNKCASDDEIDNYIKDKLNKNFQSLIDEIEQVEGFNIGVLSKAKAAGLEAHE